MMLHLGRTQETKNMLITHTHTHTHSHHKVGCVQAVVVGGVMQLIVFLPGGQRDGHHPQQAHQQELGQVEPSKAPIGLAKQKHRR